MTTETIRNIIANYKARFGDNPVVADEAVLLAFVSDVAHDVAGSVYLIGRHEIERVAASDPTPKAITDLGSRLNGFELEVGTNFAKITRAGAGDRLGPRLEQFALRAFQAELRRLAASVEVTEGSA